MGVGSCGQGWWQDGCYLGIVNNACSQAFAIQGAGEVGGLAVAVITRYSHHHGLAALDHLVVVLGDHLGHISHGSVRDLDCVAVEDTSQSMARGKAGLDEGEEGAGHVGLHPLVVGGVEPGDPALAASPPWLVGLLVHPGGCVGELVLVASPGKRLLVRGNCCLKDGLAGGDVREPPVHPQYVEFDRAGKSTSNAHISETKKAMGASLGSKFSSCRGLSSTLS